MILADKIIRLRKKNGWSQEELAVKMNVSRQAVSKWENDISCPDITLLPNLAKVLDMTTDELLTGKSDEVKFVPAEQRKPIDELVLYVHVLSAKGDKVKVTLPIPLVKVTLEVGVNIAPQMQGMEFLQGQDWSSILNQVMDMVERGLIGKIVEIESAAGDTVEIVVK
mgnify:CR=1 FL=1